MSDDKKLTIEDLKKFCKKQARLDGSDYAGDVSAYRQDYYEIKKARKLCEKYYLFHCEGESLICGEYYGTRLIISENKLEYIAGQYTPTEIYWALLDYLERASK